VVWDVVWDQFRRFGEFGFLPSREVSVFGPVGLIRRSSEVTFPIRLVFGVVSFKPDNGALALKCQDMGERLS